MDRQLERSDVHRMIATPQQLATITEVLENYCARHPQICTEERDKIGQLLLWHLESGETTFDGLNSALEISMIKIIVDSIRSHTSIEQLSNLKR